MGGRVEQRIELANRAKATTQLHHTGRWLVLAAAVLWSMSGLFAKAPWLSDWPLDVRGPLLSFWRTLFAGACLIPLVRRPTWTWWLVPATLCFAVMNVTYLTAMTRTTAANAIWLQSTAPLWVFLVGVGILHEKSRPADWLMLITVGLGVGFILFCELQSVRAHGGDMIGVLLGLISGLFYAGVVVSVRALRHLDSAWLIALNHLVTAMVLLPFVLYRGIWPTAGQAAWLAAFGVLQMGMPYVLFARGLRSVPGHQAAFIGLLEPVLVPIWVWLAWRHDPNYEPPAWWTIVGASLILTGLVARFAIRSKD
jgi:drug/metabolite transporter (DMT)-like permease